MNEAGLHIANACAEQEGIEPFQGASSERGRGSRPPSMEADTERFDSTDDDAGLRESLPVPPTNRAAVPRAPVDREAAGFKAANGVNARHYHEVAGVRRAHTDPGPARPSRRA